MRRAIGNSEKPRLCVYRSNHHIYAQIVDDSKGLTIACSSSLAPKIVSKKFKNPMERAKEVGKELSAAAVKKKVNKVVFDRRGYKYHGQIKMLAEGAREGGLKF